VIDSDNLGIRRSDTPHKKQRQDIIRFLLCPPSTLVVGLSLESFISVLAFPSSPLVGSLLMGLLGERVEMLLLFACACDCSCSWRDLE
jgi:hypothetical protein